MTPLNTTELRRLLAIAMSSKTSIGSVANVLAEVPALLDAADELQRRKDDDGFWVRFEKYDELGREVERLRAAGVGYSQQTVDAITKEREALRAENERLREAVRQKERLELEALAELDERVAENERLRAVLLNVRITAIDGDIPAAEACKSVAEYARAALERP